MANHRNKRLPKTVLQDDLNAYAALQAIAGYTPSNEQFKLAEVTASHQAMQENQTSEVQKQAAADAQRDAAAGSEWDFHEMILGAKDQVKAQFGPDSNEYQSLGLKKKSEYRRGGRRTPATGGGAT
ncbi:MAG TPA: hypothetical protein VK400_18715 [Pyrinomonadaceae bacterium]|nr:hypothetical protein [Pyrinomonadaceae bacterium]